MLFTSLTLLFYASILLNSRHGGKITMAFPCVYCSSFAGSSFKKLLSHIKFVHSFEPNFMITCGECGQSFRNFNSFKSHIQRKHNKNNYDDPGNDGDTEIEDDALAVNSSDEEGEASNDNTEDETKSFVEEMTKSLALFVLKTKEENQLTQSAIDAVLRSAGDLVESSLAYLKEQVSTCLKRNGLDVMEIEGLSDVLQRPSIFTQAVQPLQNEYQQVQYFKNHFNFVEPEEIVLSQRAEYRNIRGQQKMRLVKETFHYIPILKTLEALLSHPDILSEVRNSHASSDGLLRDFCDGSDFKSHGLFGHDPHALILHCYYDDFQVANPLGSKTKRHKIGAFYFVLGNLRPQYRSVINIIQLVALFRTSLISTYGMDRILQPFMRDLNRLESDHGVQFYVEGLNRPLRGSIGPFSDDNLGAHVVGGFIESFSSLRVCRICMGTNDDIQTKFTENQFQLRTRAGHNRHCQLILENPAMVSTHGVKRASILNHSRYFHVVDGLDLDVMHDQLEGVIPLEVKLLLKKYIQEDQYFTLQTLNERIANFAYGSEDLSNKPSGIKQQALSNAAASLSQSAAQMWCLARMLPLLIGDLIPAGDELWENFLCLLKIEDIVFAPVASTPMAAYLSILVEQYLEGFKELHDRSLIPKHHNMVHYPCLTLSHEILLGCADGAKQWTRF